MTQSALHRKRQRKELRRRVRAKGKARDLGSRKLHRLRSLVEAARLRNEQEEAWEAQKQAMAAKARQVKQKRPTGILAGLRGLSRRIFGA